MCFLLACFVSCTNRNIHTRDVQKVSAFRSALTPLILKQMTSLVFTVCFLCQSELVTRPAQTRPVTPPAAFLFPNVLSVHPRCLVFLYFFCSEPRWWLEGMIEWWHCKPCTSEHTWPGSDSSCIRRTIYSLVVEPWAVTLSVFQKPVVKYCNY